MKKFLSILLAVMMVLSTVSFAAPSLAGTADIALETPVAEAPAEEAADLAADAPIDEFGTLLAEINFNTIAQGNVEFPVGVGLKLAALGGTVTSACTANPSNITLLNGSGGTYPALTSVIKERAKGDNYLELTTNAAASYNLLQFYTGETKYFTTEDGYMTVTFDVIYGDSAATNEFFNVAFNRSQQAESHDLNEVSTVVKNGGWGKVIATFDEEIGLAGNGGNSATMLPTEVNYIKIHSAGNVKAGETFGIDNIRVYWRPKTVDVTLYVDGENDVVLNNYDTLGMDTDALAALLPEVENKVLVGFSLEEDGELMHTTKFASDCTVYPVYEERVALNGSLEFDSTDDLSKLVVRQGSNNDLGAKMAAVENGTLKLTFSATDTTKVVQDTGLNNIPVNFPAGVLTNIEIRARFTGMPTETTTLYLPDGGTRTYNPSAVNFPQLYYTTGGSFSTYGEKIVSDLSDANGNWKIFNFTVEELGITDLTTFRLDMCDFMPHGSTLEIDYIRFIGRPVRVTVDNGDNKTAPKVVMDIAAASTVAEVEAKYAKDHGDMKFVGLSRTKGGAVLASTELVSAAGAPTTLYAVWDNYEYLTKYSVDFNTETDVTKKVRIVQNNDAVDGNSTYGTTFFWNEEGGYLTLKSIAVDGYDATWDHQVYINAFSSSTALPAGVVSEIAVRMRYRNIPTTKTTLTISGRANTDFNPANNAAHVHIGKYGATAWGELLQSTNRFEKNLVDGEWFTRYLPAETYFADGLSYVRFDTAYPLIDGAEVDIDYIRFLGDNEDKKIPGAEFVGEYGERVWTVDFDDATAGAYVNGTKIDALGSEVNSWLSTAKSGITFSAGTYPSTNPVPTVTIEEKSATDKYLKYVLNANSTVSNFHFSSGSYKFVEEDGYFIVTFDYKTEDTLPFTFRMNKSNFVEDIAENFNVIDNGEWKTAVLYYDNEIGTSHPSNGNVVGGVNDLNIIKWHPTSSSKAGQTVCIDNFTLWFVPKTVEVSVDLSEYGIENKTVITKYPTAGMSKNELAKVLPAVKDREIVGLSLENGGDALYQNRIAYNATLYPVYEKVNVLDHTLEFNSSSDITKIAGLSGNALRVGKNNALKVSEQFVINEDTDGTSYLRLRNQALNGESGVVVDYGFWTSNTIVASEVKEIVIRMRIPEWAEAGTYTRETGASCKYSPSDMRFQFYFMDELGSGAGYKCLSPSINAVNYNGEWFTYTIPASEIPAETKLLRFDTPDFVAHGTVIDVDYIRFYGYPEPDAVPLKWSTDFDANESGIGLTSWKKEDGTYMYDDGVSGDFGVGTGSAFIGNADDYITWNSDGYVTVNFVANDEVKAAAAEKGATAFVYDASAYIAALDGKSYIPAGSFDELKIRMRFRDLPEDGTALYGLAYSNWKDHTWNFNNAANYFYFHYSNVVGGVLYDGATATAQSYDGMKFTEGSYAPETWFEVTIPASYFKADENALEILRLNIPNFMPDGAKLDIDYIKFYGKAPEAEAPTSESAASFRFATVDGEGNVVKDNAIRFKAAITSNTDLAASDIGWMVTTAKYLENNSISYSDFDASVAAAAGPKVIVAYNRQTGVDNTTWFDSSDDNALVFAAALNGVPANKALETLVVKPVVKAGDEYFYGKAIETSLYDVAIDPYINFISEDFASFEELVESDYTYDDAIDFDFEYNAAYEALDDTQKDYIDGILKGLLG